MGKRASIEETKRLARISSNKYKKKRPGYLGIVLKILLAGIIIYGLYFLVFVFEFKAREITQYEIEAMTVTENRVTMDILTNAYNNKLVPLDFILKLEQGEIKYTSDKEQEVVLKNGKKIKLTLGSKKIAIDGKQKRYKAPVVNYGEEILVPGDLLSDLLGETATFNEGIATYNLRGGVDKELKVFTGTEGYLKLVNKSHVLSPEYAPDDLIDVQTLGGIEAYGTNTQLRKEAAENLNKMYEASGLYFVLSSGFRDYNEQQNVFNEFVEEAKASGLDEEKAKEVTNTRVALPGTSEHQLGLATDLAIPGEVLGEDFKSTPEGAWLKINSYKYGYILRYPEDKKDLTNVIYEPWHFRYVGLPHSEYMFQNNLIFEEYNEELHQKGSLKIKSETGTEYLVWYMEEQKKPKVVKYNQDNGVDVADDNDGGIIITIPLN